MPKFHILIRKPKDLGVWSCVFETDWVQTAHALGEVLNAGHLVSGYRVRMNGERQEMVLGKEGVSSIQLQSDQAAKSA